LAPRAGSVHKLNGYSAACGAACASEDDPAMMEMRGHPQRRWSTS